MVYKSSFQAVLATVRPLIKGTHNLGEFTAGLIDMELVPRGTIDGEKTALEMCKSVTWKGYANGSDQLPTVLASELAGRWDQFRFASNVSQAYEESALNDLADRLHDLRQTIHQMDLEQAPLQEQEQDLAAEAERITRRISGELEPQLQALSTSLASLNAIIVMQAEREQHLERKQAIEDELEQRKNRTSPKGNFNPLDEYPNTFWLQMGTNLLDILGACAFPRLKDARFSRELFDALINGKTKAKEGQGYRSFVNTAVMLALREYLALEQDGGQMIIADNTKLMPDIEPLKDRCKPIVFTKREEEGRYGFLLDAQDKDLIDLEETDDN